MIKKKTRLNIPYMDGMGYVFAWFNLKVSVPTLRPTQRFDCARGAIHGG